eukprot:TRINITY_DN703_c0_g1_i1.p1 TRINITY_DN703_c0_g1~~TRINITY_DN703_c0_g1_i1.p1  ORF type:complete len:143 (-),score=35.30 TRINITY_DN703_c0_g1_i1:103-531(-)
MADDDDGPVELEVQEVGGKTDAVYQSEVQQRQSEVTKLLNAGKALDALPIALNDPPTHTKNQEIKDQNSVIVISVLTAIKEAQVDQVVANLNDEQLDVLMKYIYKGLSNGETSTPLFKWHESVLKKAGLGSIVRVMTDRKTV